MSEIAFTTPQPESVDPDRLGLLLQESGWQVVGQRAGAYVRLAPPHEDRTSVLVPLDRGAPEFRASMQSALAHIQDLVARDVGTSNISARLTAEPADGFRFRAESAAPRGLIAWTHGERLIESGRRILTAGAKTHIEHLRYYGNRFWQFAGRYLDTVLMGQTVPGSYVVTAFVPAAGSVPLTQSQPGFEQVDLFGSDLEMASTRAIGLSVMTAAAATEEAVEHYRRVGSLSAFEALVPQGVSYEMTSALRSLVEGSDGADISVDWDPAVASVEPGISHVQFRPSDFDVLTKGADQLAASAAVPEQVAVMGRVHLLTRREAGGPGVIGVENLAAEKPKRVRVHLGDKDYHRALRAHDEDRAVIVEGRMEREGNIHWIYDGRLVDVLAPIEEIRAEAAKRTVEDIPGQLELGDRTDEFGAFS